ncbi:unnamed protein product [Linum trigynum]|uniref:Uncharacterized protein n=1 Tax=Linum trigynum TaxID=586398 RepID=A0AAV2FWV5_9ROSI
MNFKKAGFLLLLAFLVISAAAARSHVHPEKTAATKRGTLVAAGIAVAKPELTCDGDTFCGDYGCCGSCDSVDPSKCDSCCQPIFVPPTEIPAVGDP